MRIMRAEARHAAASRNAREKDDGIRADGYRGAALLEQPILPSQAALAFTLHKPLFTICIQ